MSGGIRSRDRPERSRLTQESNGDTTLGSTEFHVRRLSAAIADNSKLRV